MSFASIWDIELSEQKVYQNFFCCKNAVDWACPKKHKIQLLLWYKTPKQSWRSVTMHLGKERRKQRYSIWQRNFYPPNVDFELCECGVSLVNEMLLKGKEAWSGHRREPDEGRDRRPGQRHRPQAESWLSKNPKEMQQLFIHHLSRSRPVPARGQFVGSPRFRT